MSVRSLVLGGSNLRNGRGRLCVDAEHLSIVDTVDDW